MVLNTGDSYTWGMPVISSFKNARSLKIDTGDTDPKTGERIYWQINKNSLKFESNEELFAKGICRIVDVTSYDSDTHKKTSNKENDDLVDFVVNRTYVVVDKNVEREKTNKLKKLKGYRDSLLTLGMEFSLGKNTYVIQTRDNKDIANITGKTTKLLKLMATGTVLVDLPSVFWTMRDNSVPEMTGEEFLNLADGVESFVQDCHTNFLVHRLGINGCEDIVSLNAYDFTLGWPNTPEPE